jgi:hypothetical protein
MSDHISGPRALAVPIADITDFYAFPSPERGGRLVLVMNTLPFARVSDAFSSGLIYRFRLRPLRLDPSTNSSPFRVDDRELVVDCTFDPSESRLDGELHQRGTCSPSTGEVLQFETNTVTRANADGDLRVFAGPRWDPFIMDAPAALKTIATGQPAFTDSGSIFLDGKNVLGLVIEFDCSKLFPDVELVGVVAETLTRGDIPVRFERVGRPEVKNLLLAPKQFDAVNRDLEIRDLYNMEDAFHLAEAYQGAYRARLNANLAFWDRLDGKIDWPLDEQGAHPLTELLLADFLVVDPTKPYSEHGSFLGIESAARQGRPHATCGGRTLNDDVMDSLYTLLINAGTGPTISDGVDGASTPASCIFPYLAPANPNPPERPAHL